MIKEIHDSKIITPITDGNITILFRGKTFRGVNKTDYDDQIAAVHSVEKFVITPIKRTFPNCNINVIICTYENKLNIELAKIFKQDYGHNVELFHIPNDVTGQIYSYKCALGCIQEENEFVFILRPDLIFQKEIDLSRADKDKILFQWNLFTHYAIKRVPDQYQFVGGNVFNRYKELVLNKKIDTINAGTLHNLYNFLIKYNWSLDNISYLNYIENPNPHDPNCAIKGDPSSHLGNPLFKYTIKNKDTRRITN